MNLGKFWSTLKEAFSQYGEDDISRLAAALAYYTIFSLAPILVIVLAVAGFIWGEQAARGQIVNRISTVVGPQAAQGLQTLIQNAGTGSGGIIATIIGLVTLIIGATTVFDHLQNSLNKIWHVEGAGDDGVMGMLTSRLEGLLIVIGLGLVLLAFLVLGSILPTIQSFVPNLGSLTQVFMWAAYAVLAFVLLSGVFAVLFKVLPDTTVTWGDVAVGAGFTALLFLIGQILIGLYFGLASPASAFGAAGSIIILLIWIYYSAQLVLIGAEFTAVYAKRHGSMAAVTKQQPAMEQRMRPEQRYAERRLRHGVGEGEAIGVRRRASMRPEDQQRGAVGLTFGLVISAALAVIGLVANAIRRDTRRPY